MWEKTALLLLGSGGVGGRTERGQGGAASVIWAAAVAPARASAPRAPRSRLPAAGPCGLGASRVAGFGAGVSAREGQGAGRAAADAQVSEQTSSSFLSWRPSSNLKEATETPPLSGERVRGFGATFHSGH